MTVEKKISARDKKLEAARKLLDDEKNRQLREFGVQCQEYFKSKEFMEQPLEKLGELWLFLHNNGYFAPPPKTPEQQQFEAVDLITRVAKEVFRSEQNKDDIVKGAGNEKEA